MTEYNKKQKQEKGIFHVTAISHIPYIKFHIKLEKINKISLFFGQFKQLTTV